MTYNTDGEIVTLTMTREDYSRLLVMLGYAAGKADSVHGPAGRWPIMAFVNEMNRTNPNWTPYAIPEEFRQKE